MVLLITTCGGRTAEYRQRLQRQIDDSGWGGRRILVSDGPLADAAAGWTITATPVREGQKKTYWRALAVGLEECRKTDDNRILILEDDVELCTNALPYM